MNYLTLKYLHIICVAGSFSLFFIRGIWLLRSYPHAQEPWIRALPHVIDSLLVASAIGMLALGPKGVWDGNWMLVKVVLVVVYAVMSVLLLRLAKGKVQKILLWVAALLVFLFATTVSVLHHPLGIFLVL
jgi:uncharacterized membrane protein SirB2